MTEETIAGLRELADWLEQHPEQAAHLDLAGGTKLYHFSHTREEFTDAARALGGHRQKNADDAWFNVERQFGPITVQVTIAREKVCEKIVTPREVTKHVPDPALVSEIPLVAVTEVVEDVEWVCVESLMAEMSA